MNRGGGGGVGPTHTQKKKDRIKIDSGRRKKVKKKNMGEKDDARMRQREVKGGVSGGEGGERNREGDYVRPCPKRIMR